MVWFNRILAALFGAFLAIATYFLLENILRVSIGLSGDL